MEPLLVADKFNTDTDITQHFGWTLTADKFDFSAQLSPSSSIS